MKIIDDNGADREFLERIANLEHLEKVDDMSELKPCPTMAHHRANCRECNAAWNQRQPHPDSSRLKWLVVNNATVYGFSSPCDGYAVVTTENEVETCTHDFREAIDKAMEQEK